LSDGDFVISERTVPAEWEPHSHTIVSWPTRKIVWSPLIEEAYDEYLQVIQAVLPYEPVLLICREQDRKSVLDFVPREVQLVVHPIDDGWIRDNGPLAVRVDGSLLAVDFEFNSWGGRFAPWEGDSTVGVAVTQELGVAREHVSFVLEGGAISFNGDGTALVVEECVLNKNRNGEVSREHFEQLVRKHLGVQKVIWLPFGLLEDLPNTDGHVDNVAIFVDTNRVLVQMTDRDNPNFQRLSRNLEVLRSSRDARGSLLEVEIVSFLPYAEMPDGTEQPVPYLNLAITNGGLLVPSVGSKFDSTVCELLGGLFPGRSLALVSSRVLAHGGGGPHCITMQWPSISN
jgi:agmatine deiminase